MFRTVLVPNRGEVAVRVVRTLRRLGIRSVVAASIPDRVGLAARLADDVVLLPGVLPGETYLNVEAVLEAAKRSGADAIHPGWGFLAESPALAEACAEAGITFVGPSPRVLRALGDKQEAREAAKRLGIPVSEGVEGGSVSDLAAKIREVGLPVMVKARAGGGGRGMRVLRDGDDVESALRSAFREAESAFGDGRLFAERLVEGAHHVEVQVLADAHGRVLHLGERECSVQRRHQKVVEESPSPVVDGPLREKLCAAAVRLAAAVGYENAGTVEFLVGPPGPQGERPFYFLEVNPRLQVEHPVTELRTGLDLVELQLRVAAGEPLPFAQDEVRFDGHAIECRVNAEDPSRGFAPSAGRLDRFGPCDCAGAVRWDAGYESGDEVPPHYDSLLAKLVVLGAYRAAALARLEEALGALHVGGVRTNLQLLRGIARSPSFRSGGATTSWLEEELELALERGATPARVWRAVQEALAYAGCDHSGAAEAWRVRPRWFGAGRLVCWVSDGCEVRAIEYGGERRSAVRANECREPGCLRAEGYCLRVAEPPPLPPRAAEQEGLHEAVTAPLAGRVREVLARAGDTVAPGDLLVVLEAMKMEHRVVATAPGKVVSVRVAPGDIVAEGQTLLELA